MQNWKVFIMTRRTRAEGHKACSKALIPLKQGPTESSLNNVNLPTKASMRESARLYLPIKATRCWVYCFPNLWRRHSCIGLPPLKEWQPSLGLSTTRMRWSLIFKGSTSLMVGELDASMLISHLLRAPASHTCRSFSRGRYLPELLTRTALGTMSSSLSMKKIASSWLPVHMPMLAHHNMLTSISKTGALINSKSGFVCRWAITPLAVIPSRLKSIQ